MLKLKLLHSSPLKRELVHVHCIELGVFKCGLIDVRLARALDGVGSSGELSLVQLPGFPTIYIRPVVRVPLFSDDRVGNPCPHSAWTIPMVTSRPPWPGSGHVLSTV